MIISVAWKNVWRNRKRSFIVITAVLLGTTAGAFTSGLMKGWVDQRIRSAIYTESSHLKLHNPDFLNNEEIGNTIAESGQIIRFLKNSSSVKAFSTRVKLMTMVSTSRGNTALMLNGIDLEQEKAVSDLYTKMVNGGGSFLDGIEGNQVVISDKTAEQLRIKNYQLTEEILDSLKNAGIPSIVTAKLLPIVNVRFNTEKLIEKKASELLKKGEVSKYGAAIIKASEHYRLRSKVVLTFTDKTGELINQSFRVCGIFKTSNTMFDQINAFVLKKDICPTAGLGENEFHEISMLMNDGYEPEQLQEEIRKKFPDISALTWKELASDAGMLSDFMSLYYYIIMGFILFALAFGIINTMLMAILERTKELGMLMAIGMNRKRVFSMIMYETIFLTLVGAVAGMGAGWLIIRITGHTGLNFSSVGEGFESMGWSAVVYPDITASFFFGVTLMVIATGILSSIPPSRKALKLNPVEAIRTDN
jgi:ABC-type lipoprotein release transport system permease subunit